MAPKQAAKNSPAAKIPAVRILPITARDIELAVKSRQLLTRLTDFPAGVPRRARDEVHAALVELMADAGRVSPETAKAQALLWRAVYEADSTETRDGATVIDLADSVLIESVRRILAAWPQESRATTPETETARPKRARASYSIMPGKHVAGKNPLTEAEARVWEYIEPLEYVPKRSQIVRAAEMSESTLSDAFRGLCRRGWLQRKE